MTISPVLLKGFIGAATVTTLSVGCYSQWDKISDLFGGKTKKLKITKWDLEIIKEIDGSDLNFSVKKGSGVLNSFPAFESNSNEVTIVLSLDKSTISGKSSLKALNKSNEGGDSEWGWECSIKFSRKGDEVSNLTLNSGDYKDFIYKDNNKGVLGRLGQSNNKTLKKRIVELCAKNRGHETNKHLNKLENLSKGDSKHISENTIKSNVDFELVKDGTNDKLKFSSKEQFEEWFEIPSKITKLDIELDKYLESKDFNFEVKTKVGDSEEETDLSSNFPTFTTTNQKQNVIVKTTVGDASLKDLKTIVGTLQTWECIVSFEKKSTVDGSEFKDDANILKFLKKLKEVGNKELKRKFINDCVKFRSALENESGTKVSTTINIELDKNSDGKLEVKNDSKKIFTEIFGNLEQTKQ